MSDSKTQTHTETPAGDEPVFQFSMGSIKGAMKEGAGKSDLWFVPRDQIKVVPGFNVRDKDAEYIAAVREYADSMKANGFYRNKALAGYVAVENGENVIYVTDGHTRLDAVDLANAEGAEIHKIPMIISPAGTNAEDLTVALVTSNSGRNLRPHEIAKVVKRLIGYNMSTEEIAKRLAFTKVYVESLLKLLEAPHGVREMVKEGKVSATLAIETYKKHGADAEKLLQDGLATATSLGKEKLTKKNIPAGAKKVNPFKAGVTFLREEKLDPHVSDVVMKVVARMTGKTVDEVLEALTAPETKAPKKKDSSDESAAE
jgi:ParB family transcriptional regulator, chromosome partitioning protein